MFSLKRFFARPFDPARAADQAVASLKSALGPELAGVLAFGSWAVGEYVEGRSDLNLLVVTRRLDSETVKRLSPVLAALAEPRFRPLCFSLPELRRHAEAFPLKFQDMADTRKPLFGEDPFQRLDVSAARLAEDVEREARHLLIRFRQRWLLRSAEGGAAGLVSDTLGEVLPLLRGMLRLAKRKPARQRVRVIEDACRQFRLSRRVLLQAHDLRYGRKNAARIDAPGLLDHLLPELERLAEICVKQREEESAAPRGERRERGERPERSERFERGERPERGDSGERRPGPGGDRNRRMTEVRQMVADAALKKRWEPKEADRFASDEMARDAALGLAARFAWDRAWQPERRAKGYVAVKPAEPEPPAPEEEQPRPAVALSGEEAAAAAWADEVEDEPDAEAGAPPEADAGAAEPDEHAGTGAGQGA